jgi:hypothetical protein
MKKIKNLLTWYAEWKHLYLARSLFFTACVLQLKKASDGSLFCMLFIFIFGILIAYPSFYNTYRNRGGVLGDVPCRWLGEILVVIAIIMAIVNFLL